MDTTYLVLAAVGAAGALVYSFPLYLKAMKQNPPESFALATLFFSVFVGGLFSILLTNFIGYHWSWTVKPEPWPLALVIGLSSNMMVPVVLKKIQDWAEKFEGTPA